MQLKYVFDVVEKKKTEKLSYHLRFCQLIILKRLKVKKKKKKKEKKRNRLKKKQNYLQPEMNS